MTSSTIERLKSQGWFLSEHGFDRVSDSGAVNDIHKIVKRAIEFDLKEIGSGEGDLSQGNLVVQIQKLRNVAAAKSNEESRTAPRMLKLSLTDGKNNIQALEVEHINSLSLNTPPGTKLLINSGGLDISHGVLLLRPYNIGQILGGKVTSMIEKWELNKKLALHSRVRSQEEGGPPPWIPFGKKILKVVEQEKNFKALAEKDMVNKESTEFDAQRKDAIAEAAKQGSRKVFGGGNKQMLDHSVQKIVDQGFTIEQAENALRISRNNVDRALRSLHQTFNKQNAPREPREPRNKRFEKKTEESKPSSGKVSLFDFLEEKLPGKFDNLEISSPQVPEEYPKPRNDNPDRYESRGGGFGRSGRGGQKGGRGNQSTRSSADDKSGPNKRSAQWNSTQQSKPPRFQKSQDNNTFYQQDDRYQRGSSFSNGNRNNLFVQPRSDDEAGDGASYNRTFQNSRGKSSNNRGTPSNEPPNSKYFNNSQNYGNSSYNYKNPEVVNRGSKSQLNRYQQAPPPVNEPNLGYATYDKGYNSNGLSSPPTNTFMGSFGDANCDLRSIHDIGERVVAKCWEENEYRYATIRGITPAGYKVLFDHYNYDVDVFREDILSTDNSRNMQGNCDTRQGQYNRPPHQRYEQNQQSNFMISGMEFRRSGGNSGAPPPPPPGNKGANKKRGTQRNAQMIYQPPAQRSFNNAMPMTSQQQSNLSDYNFPSNVH